MDSSSAWNAALCHDFPRFRHLFFFLLCPDEDNTTSWTLCVKEKRIPAELLCHFQSYKAVSLLLINSPCVIQQPRSVPQRMHGLFPPSPPCRGAGPCQGSERPGNATSQHGTNKVGKLAGKLQLCKHLRHKDPKEETWHKSYFHIIALPSKQIVVHGADRGA